MKWVKDTTKHSIGEVLYLGPWNVGTIHYNRLWSKGDLVKYIAVCKLPGYEWRGEFRFKKDAKAAVESAFEYWLSKLPEQKEN
jgi:hypothetical protein